MYQDVKLYYLIFCILDSIVVIVRRNTNIKVCLVQYYNTLASSKASVLMGYLVKFPLTQRQQLSTKTKRTSSFFSHMDLMYRKE